MKISKRTQYGLRAIIFLARHPKKIFSLSEISKKEKISKDFLEKILSKLAKRGFIKAKKGIQGGYFLFKKPQQIKVIKIIEALEGSFDFVKCLQGVCPFSKNCCAKKFWQKFQRSLKQSMSKITLADLL